MRCSATHSNPKHTEAGWAALCSAPSATAASACRFPPPKIRKIPLASAALDSPIGYRSYRFRGVCHAVLLRIAERQKCFCTLDSGFERWAQDAVGQHAKQQIARLTVSVKSHPQMHARASQGDAFSAKFHRIVADDRNHFT